MKVVPRRFGIVLLLLVGAAHAGCSTLRFVWGRIEAEDGATGIPCAMIVQLLPSGSSESCGLRPPEGEAMVFSSVPTGAQFQCRVSMGAGEYEVRAECPGYQPLAVRFAVDTCDQGLFGPHCDPYEMGTVVARR